MSDDRENRERLEAPIREACERGDQGLAAQRTLELYGADIMSFLAARLRSGSDASEVFSMFTEDFWRGLPAFGWRASMRSWLYTLARNAANRFKVAPHNRAARNLTFTQNAPLSRLVEHVRTRTAMHQRTEVKSAMRELREQLSEDEQTLLMLRVDRGLPWRELAIVLESSAQEGVELTGDALEQASARVRKRFQLVKDKLKQMAQDAGVL